ncbi:ComEA family DNA-binding protein [bacterium]|nr:ComEA family DNA-binding protein [bacterium]
MNLKHNLKDYSFFLALVVFQVVLIAIGFVLLGTTNNKTSLTSFTAPTKELTDNNQNGVISEPQVTGTSTERGLMVNINKDNVETLALLPGIGEVTAQSIVNYRESNGLFKTLEEIKNVDGIGDQTFENIKPYIVVE